MDAGLVEQPGKVRITAEADTQTAGRKLGEIGFVEFDHEGMGCGTKVSGCGNGW